MSCKMVRSGYPTCAATRRCTNRGDAERVATERHWRGVESGAENIAAAGGRLISLWASRDTAGAQLVRAAFAADAGVLVLDAAIGCFGFPYPGLEQSFPSASRMQRAIADLSGLHSTDADQRPWLRHAAWPADFPSTERRRHS